MDTNTSHEDRRQVTPRDPVPAGRDAAVIEAWFAEVGLAVTVVDHCPINACESCRRALPAAA